MNHKIPFSAEAKQFYAESREMSVEEYEVFLEDASTKVLANMEQYPDAQITVDQDVAEYMELAILGQAATPEEMQEYEDSVGDAELVEVREEG